MAQGQPPEKTYESPLARRIRQELTKKHMTQKELSVASGLEETQISRILNDGPIKIDDNILDMLAIGLDIRTAGRDELTHLAYPKRKYHNEALQRGENYIELTCRLYEQGIDLSKIR